MSTDDAALRAQLRAQFERWLEALLADEAPPDGIDAALLAELGGEADTPPPGTDLASLWEAMTAARQEVALQGRAFARLEQTLAPLAERAASAPARVEDPRPGRRELLSVLLDVRDRLDRGRAEARRARPGRLVRWLGGGDPVVTALEDGYRLALDRIDDQLTQLGVLPRVREGDAFDARTMRGVEVLERPGVAAGTVLEVVQQGYQWDDQTLRVAQVRVAGGAPAAADASGASTDE